MLQEKKNCLVETLTFETPFIFNKLSNSILKAFVSLVSNRTFDMLMQLYVSIQYVSSSESLTKLS